jgi:fatty-acid peroxygenase
MVAARVRKNFQWKDYDFVQGRRVLLDLHGTNHDAKSWDAPELFRPERFIERASNPFDFIPQGSGNAHIHHRCPGEGIAVALMKTVLRFLTKEIEYEVIPQDLEIDTSRMPALPRSGFVISSVRVR